MSRTGSSGEKLRLKNKTGETQTRGYLRTESRDMKGLIAGLALTPPSVFSAAPLDSHSESLSTKQRRVGALSLDVAERPGGYRDDGEFSKGQDC